MTVLKKMIIILVFGYMAVITQEDSIIKARETVIIGTGGLTGVYYPTGAAICRLVNKSRDKHGIRCAVESTDGSIHNINAIRAEFLQKLNRLKKIANCNLKLKNQFTSLNQLLCNISLLRHVMEPTDYLLPFHSF